MPLLLKPLCTRAFFFLYLLGITSSFVTIPNWKDAHMYENAPMELFLDVYVVCAVLCLIPKSVRAGKFCLPLRTAAKVLVYAIAYPLYIIDTFCWVKFGSTINPAMLMLMGETNSNEAGEFFASYVTTDTLFSHVGWFLLIAVTHILCALYWDKIAGKRIAQWWQRHGFRLPNLPFSIVSSLVVGGLLVWAGIKSYDNKRLYHHTMTRETIGELEHHLVILKHTNIYKPGMRLLFSIYSNK